MESEGFDSFSMRELAERAEVSVATLYNLCGSKAGILSGLMESTLAELARASGRGPRADALRQANHIVESAVDIFVARPSLHRPLLRELLAGKSSDTTAVVARLCRQRLQDCLARGVRDRLLASDLRTDLLAHQILISFAAVLDLWTQEVIDDDGFRHQSLHSLQLFLLAAAAPEARPRVRRALTRLERKLETATLLWESPPCPSEV